MLLRASARDRAGAASQGLGAAHRDEYGATVAQSAQAAASRRSAQAGLYLVHRRLRYAGSKERQIAARRASVLRRRATSNMQLRTSRARTSTSRPSDRSPTRLRVLASDAPTAKLLRGRS